MTFFRRKFFAHGAEPADGGRVAMLSRARAVDASLAVSFEDFMQAAPFVRQATGRSCASISEGEVGQILCRLHDEGSGPSCGGLILARHGDGLVGFALLRPDRSGRMELSWMYAEGPQRDAVLAALWRAVARSTASWSITKVQVSAFVPLPAELAAAETPSAPARQRRAAAGLGFWPRAAGFAAGAPQGGYGYG